MDYARALEQQDSRLRNLVISNGRGHDFTFSGVDIVLLDFQV